MPKNYYLTERDVLALSICFKFRVVTEDQLHILCNFPTLKRTRERLRLLSDRGYLKRTKALTDTSFCCTGTQKASDYLGINIKPYKLSLATLKHELSIVDIAMYMFLRGEATGLNQIMTDRELFYYGSTKNIKNIGNIHRPDLLLLDNKMIVECEKTLKSKNRYLKHVIENALHYKNYKQIWILWDNLLAMPEHLKKEFTKRNINYEIIYISEMQKYIKSHLTDKFSLYLDEDFGSALNNYDLLLANKKERRIDD